MDLCRCQPWPDIGSSDVIVTVPLPWLHCPLAPYPSRPSPWAAQVASVAPALGYPNNPHPRAERGPFTESNSKSPRDAPHWPASIPGPFLTILTWLSLQGKAALIGQTWVTGPPLESGECQAYQSDESGNGVAPKLTLSSQRTPDCTVEQKEKGRR